MISVQYEPPNALANYAFTYLIQCVKWHNSMPKGVGAKGNKIGHMQLLYGLAGEYGQEELCGRWEKDATAAGVKVE